MTTDALAMTTSLAALGLCLLLSGLVGTAIGQGKERAFDGAILGLVLGPLGWLLMAREPHRTVHCVECSGLAVRGARLCRHCGSALVHPETPSSPQLTADLAGAQVSRDAAHAATADLA